MGVTVSDVYLLKFRERFHTLYDVLTEEFELAPTRPNSHLHENFGAIAVEGSLKFYFFQKKCIFAASNVWGPLTGLRAGDEHIKGVESTSYLRLVELRKF